MTRERGFQANEWAIIFLLIAVFYLQHLLSINLGINYEECRDGNAYLLAMEGYRPYQDFEWVYGPLSFLIYPPVMKIFGVNLIVLRLSYIIFASFVIPLAYFLSRKIMPPFWASVAGFLAINLFDIPYYTFNHIFAVLGELGCLLMVVRAMETKKYGINLFLAGFFAAITVMTKPFFSGAILFCFILLFLIILKVKNEMPIRFKAGAIFFTGPIFIIAALFSYFYLGSAIKAYLLTSTPFSPDIVGGLYNVGGISPEVIATRFFTRFGNAFALHKILLAGSFYSLKDIIVKWFDDFIFSLPFLAPMAIIIIYNTFGNRKKEIQKIFRNNKITLLLLIIFSILISTENLVVGHRMSRAFNMQATFILLTFLFYILTEIASERRKKIVFSLFIIIIIFLSSFHFIRYPLSRSRKFTAPLELERGRGILLTPAEKHLYESLSDYLSSSLNRDEKIVVLGYNPQYSFLTGYKSLFYYEECIFLKLEDLAGLSEKNQTLIPQLRLLENGMIKAMELYKPKIILDVVFEGVEPLYNNLVGDYIRKNYALKKSFGPAEIYGIKGYSSYSGKGRVDLYTLR